VAGRFSSARAGLVWSARFGIDRGRSVRPQIRALHGAITAVVEREFEAKSAQTREEFSSARAELHTPSGKVLAAFQEGGAHCLRGVKAPGTATLREGASARGRNTRVSSPRDRRRRRK
jgi:hypothetical protein